MKELFPGEEGKTADHVGALYAFKAKISVILERALLLKQRKEAPRASGDCTSDIWV
jgi:hypothetical protein